MNTSQPRRCSTICGSNALVQYRLPKKLTLHQMFHVVEIPFEERAMMSVARVVDQDLDRPETIEYGRRRFEHLRALGDVALHDEWLRARGAQLSRQLFELGAPARHQCHACALAAEPQRDQLADPARRAGDDGVEITVGR